MIAFKAPLPLCWRTYSLIVLAFVLAASAAVGAQVSRVGAALEGTVRDKSGAVISHAKVTVRNALTGQSRVLDSNDQGLYRADQLPVGSYEVRLQQAGFALYQQTGLILSLGQTLRLDITLVPASASESLTVSAQSSELDTTQTSLVSSVDQERIEELPVESRNYLDFVLLAPGVSKSPAVSGVNSSTPLAGSGFTFGGLRPESNNVAIDGLDNNDEFTGSSRTELSPEIVQEFQVVNTGISAESGGASGGSINVVTRGGTNAVHGDAFIFAQDSAFNARDPFENQPGKPSFRRFREGFALGGPVVKNKTFYYAAVEQEHNCGQIGSDIDPGIASDINTLLGAGAFPGLRSRRITTGFSPIARAETEAAGRVDHQLSPSTSLMFRYAFTNNKEAGDAFNINGLTDATARGSSFISDNGLSGSLTTALGSQAVSDFRFQVATRRAVLRTNDANDPEINIAGLLTFGRPYAGNSQRHENHYQADYSYARTKSKHLWKVGGAINRVRERAEVPDGFGGVYLFGSLADFMTGNPDQFRQDFGNPRVDFPVTAYGLFAQDHWSATRQLTVDFGVRYDFEHLPGQFSRDKNNFSPRVGLAWSPSDKWVFRAGYGIFFDRYVLASLARTLTRGGSQGFEQVADGGVAATLFALARGGSLHTPTVDIAPSIYVPNSRLLTPYSQQANAGAEYLLAKNLTLRGDYLFVHGVRLPRTINSNLLPPLRLTSANAAFLGVPDPTPQQIGREVFAPARRNPSFDDIYELRDSASSTYNGASLTITRTMNEELEFSANYTVSKAYDNASDYNEQPQNPFNLGAERGLSRQDQRQRFVFNALWDLPIGEEENAAPGTKASTGPVTRIFGHIELAPILTAESGVPLDPLTGLDSSRTHAFPLSARPLTFSRNSIRTPGLVTMDLRLVKYFPLGEAKRLDLVAESFNLFNRANVSEVNPVFGSNLSPMPAFREPIASTGARRIEFSLDFEF